MCILGLQACISMPVPYCTDTDAVFQRADSLRKEGLMEWTVIYRKGDTLQKYSIIIHR